MLLVEWEIAWFSKNNLTLTSFPLALGVVINENENCPTFLSKAIATKILRITDIRASKYFLAASADIFVECSKV